MKRQENSLKNKEMLNPQNMKIPINYHGLHQVNREYKLIKSKGIELESKEH